MDAFVLQGKGFVRLPKENVGTFYSTDCYVFMCKQVCTDSRQASSANYELIIIVFFGSKWRLVNDGADEEAEEELECIAYFWQGRDAQRIGWLTFSFGFATLPSSSCCDHMHPFEKGDVLLLPFSCLRASFVRSCRQVPAADGDAGARRHEVRT
jgi:hypothetical protein